MTQEFDTKATPLVQRYLDRAPHVISYDLINEDGYELFRVRIDTRVKVPAIIRAEARQLGIRYAEQRAL